MLPATTTRQRKRTLIAVIGVVLLAHALVVWWVRAGLALRPVDEAVVTVQMVSPWIRPAPVAPALQPAIPSKTEVPAPPVTGNKAQTTQAPPTGKPLPAAMLTTGTPAPVTPVAALHEVPAGAVGGAMGGPVGGAVGGVMNNAAGNAATSTLANGAVSATQASADASSPPRVDLPSSDADYLHNPKPEYPRLSRQRNEHGKVVVKVLIGVDGLPQKAEIKVSSGFERLDTAALTTAMAWRYVPGKRGGVPEAMWFLVPIQFVMD